MKKTSFGFLIGLFVALSLTALAGESPWNVLLIIVNSAFGSRYDIGLTLFYTTPLIFCGLSVAWAFRAGLFNIGAEGQLVLGCLGAASLTGFNSWLSPAGLDSALSSSGVDLFRVFALGVALVLPLLAGGFWGFLAGWMKTRHRAHEVIVTMMLNFVASALASYVILNLIPNPSSQNPESRPLNPIFLFKGLDPIATFFPESSVSLALILAIICALGSWFIFNKSRFGYQMKMLGLNPQAAERSGISLTRVQLGAMTIAGVMAGGVAWAEILGSSGQFKLGFSPDYGFLGIAVALMAQNNPLGILLSAFLLGALQKGAADLDMETLRITRDFSKVIQASIILFVASPGLWLLIRNRFEKFDLRKSGTPS